jgi:hypothetical protein
MPGIYTEKEIYQDALTAQKTATSEMNMAANECVHEEVRKTMMHILIANSLNVPLPSIIESAVCRNITLMTTE